MNRTEKLKRYCEGRKKSFVAEKELGVPAQMMTYLLKYDIDKIVSRIDALRVEQETRKVTRRRVA